MLSIQKFVTDAHVTEIAHSLPIVSINQSITNLYSAVLDHGLVIIAAPLNRSWRTALYKFVID